MDRDLVEQAQHGDREAFAILARTHADRLMAIAQRILRDVGRAEDAVQQTLVIAWRELPTLRDPERFDAWLQRLLVNASYAEARRWKAWNANVRILRVDGPAGPDEIAVRRRPRPARARLSTAPARPAGDLGFQALPGFDADRDRRPARRSRSERPGPDSTMPTERCARPSRPMSDLPRQPVDGLDDRRREGSTGCSTRSSSTARMRSPTG